MSQQKKLAGNAADKRSRSRWRKLWNAETMYGTRLRKRLLNKKIRRMEKPGKSIMAAPTARLRGGQKISGQFRK